MALSANSVFEVQTGGNDTNGGGFVTGAAGTDYSLVAAKRTATGSNDSTTDAVAVGTGVITSVTAAFTSAIVGNIIYLQGGTGALAAGWYQVTVFTSATSITVDRNVVAGTGITMNIGGALASPGMSGGVGLVAGNIIYIKAGTYTIASATINIATGCFSSSLAIQIQGYQTTRGDFGTAPLLQASGISTFTIINSTGASSIQNLNCDGASLTSSRAFVIFGIGYRLTASNCTNSAYTQSTNATFVQCTATGCSVVSPFFSGHYYNCIAYSNTALGFTLIAARTARGCIAASNSGATTDGFSVSAAGNPQTFTDCVAYGNGRDGFRIGDSNILVQNCIAEGNTGIGFNSTTPMAGILLINCAGFNNTGGNVSLNSGNLALSLNFVTGTSSFFVNAAGLNFALNNTASAGAAARAAGYPGILPIGGTGFRDIGVLQHADPASGAGGARLAGIGGLASAG